ncbi:BA75_00656T0 [Komagataella pastoris]|uniref:BA75_00656T0 n=1 Tax=Komagataella pastoris TaxID=4922 RepID=A0A1B2J7Z2_PICPA|nr:BA75_00656T0 [Komagataella pastoris]
MCRFLIFKGEEPMLLANLLTRPAHSIINQSFDSRLRVDMRRPMNGDGFGVGYYTEEDDDNDCDAHDSDGPCVFRAITPAWNNLNLERLADKTRSRLTFAHVRASTYGVLSETNCHPFTYHNIMFMHNGGIGNFSKVKRKLINHIDDEYFLHIQGSTDSECSFALFLDTLHKMGHNPKGKDLGHKILRECLVKTIGFIKGWAQEVEVDASVKEPSLLNFAVTDGSSIVVSRYVTSKTDAAASLHFSTGSRFLEYEPGQFHMERLDRSQNIIMIASEPLTFERGDWITVPTNSTLSVKGQTVLLHPIVDEYYQSDPAFERNASFAESKGLMGSLPVSGTIESSLPPLDREGRTRSSMVSVKQ